MLSPQKRVHEKIQASVGVAEFHRCSRLHFLGTWRERFERWRSSIFASEDGSKRYGLIQESILAQLNEEMQTLHDLNAPPLWAHLDMDCFFASVATRDLALKEGSNSTPQAEEIIPTAVTSGLGHSSEICSANYAARRLGVNTHLWSLEKSLAVLPTLRVIPISAEILQSVESTWQQVYQLLVAACFGDADCVRMRSCDEAVIQLQSIKDPMLWAQALKKAVRQQTQGCNCSIGIGLSQIVAKLATKACKPDGARRIVDTEVQSFLDGIPLSDLPQVGRAFISKLSERGFECCRDVYSVEHQKFKQMFGAKGETLWLNCRGLDSDSALQQQTQQRRTMSADINWGVRTSDNAAALKVLSEVVSQLCERLRLGNLSAIHLTLKLKIAVLGWVEPVKHLGHGLCDDVSRSAALPGPTSEDGVIGRLAEKLYLSINPDPVRLRGVGLAARLSGSSVQQGLSSASHDSSTSSGLGRWLRPQSGTPNCLPADRKELPLTVASSTVVDLDAECDESFDTSEELICCPVCGQMQPRLSADAHVNSHFDTALDATSPRSKKRRRIHSGDDASPHQGKSGNSDSECELVG